jgi:peptidoglycan/xylan/chitin deacetylase (PgdA/CDA1 family)
MDPARFDYVDNNRQFPPASPVTTSQRRSWEKPANGVRVRSVLWNLARRSGLFGAWRHMNRHGISILMAHGIMDDGPGASWRPLWSRIHVEQFERALRVLKDHYDFIGLGEAAEILSGARPERPHCMVLTFDDGYRNNFTHALPILERLGIPATFFVSTGFIGSGQRYWIDRIDHAIQKLPSDRRREIKVGDTSIGLDFSSREALAASYTNLRLALKRTYGEDFDDVVNDIAEQLEQEAGYTVASLGDHDPWSGIITWDEARQAAERGMEIGSHTMDHVRLGLTDAQTVRAQLEGSRAAIELHTHRKCRSLAYPNGSFTAAVANAAKDAGYECAVSTQRGLNRRGDDLFTLKRFAFPTKRGADQILAAASGFEFAVRDMGRTGTD